MNDPNFKTAPMQDLFIHYLFTSPDSNGILKSFINAVLADSEGPLIQSVTIENTFDPQSFSEEKGSINDIQATDSEGRVYEIEIQTLNHPSLANRVLYDWSRKYRGQLKREEDCRPLNPVISIVITRFLMFPELDGPHNPFYITCQQDTQYILTDDLQIHFIELIPQKLNQLPQMAPEIQLWLDFLENADKKGEEELSVLRKKESGIGEAYRKYESFHQSPELRALAEERWRNELCKRTLLEDACDKGLEKG
ncbi:MAG: Rpn family recombination-promoting nuclease/putative transposase [Planctomycetia bacterium]|nr:Rpn family recombination-promoting nuclease/putative transposase [Planctomycetia bacterium]